jgi:hypothetical protein
MSIGKHLLGAILICAAALVGLIVVLAIGRSLDRLENVWPRAGERCAGPDATFP